MEKIKAFEVREGFGEVFPLPVTRDWMEETWQAHAYKCFPISLTNQLGWGISFPEDISFIWDGISDSSPEHVKILKGSKYAYSGRANGTVSFYTGIKFETDEDISLLQMPAPNYMHDGAQPLAALISTSFFNTELPCAWKITRPNVEITIKANTPVISILPIDLSKLQNSEINFMPLSSMKKSGFSIHEYSKAAVELNKQGKWSNFYRNATDHLGNMIGKHQVKTIKLKVK